MSVVASEPDLDVGVLQQALDALEKNHQVGLVISCLLFCFLIALLELCMSNEEAISLVCGQALVIRLLGLLTMPPVWWQTNSPYLIVICDCVCVVQQVMVATQLTKFMEALTAAGAPAPTTAKPAALRTTGGPGAEGGQLPSSPPAKRSKIGEGIPGATAGGAEAGGVDGEGDTAMGEAASSLAALSLPGPDLSGAWGGGSSCIIRKMQFTFMTYAS